MAPWPGELDPGLPSWLIREQGLSETDIERMHYCDGGLLDVAGASGAPHARDAIEPFVYRIHREIGSLAAAAGGLGALVLTCGIGGQAAPVRAAVGRQRARPGVALDEAANRRGGPKASAAEGKVEAWVIPTD
jgi:acetate kinase